MSEHDGGPAGFTRTRQPGRLAGFERAMLPLLLMLAAGCAGSTLGSGVGDALIERSPYYAGAGVLPGGSQRIVHLPVAFQRGASQPSIFDPTASDDLRALLDDMTRYLDSLGASRRLVEGGSVSAVTHRLTAGPPDVSFGCLTASGAPGDECAERGDSALGRGDQRMRLAVTRASPDWVRWIGEVMASADVDGTLVVTLEVGQYLMRQAGWAGRKELELGTDYVVRLPWLTSLETPVLVLQLTGALVGRDGKAARIGAEGLYARRTSLPLSALGAQRLLGDEDVAALRLARREDLPGAPLAWQVGLRTLVGQLLRRPELR